MRTAILAPGPSLPLHWEGADWSQYSEVIAVNTAGHRYPHDWLAFADWHIIRHRNPDIAPPRKGYLCKGGMWPGEKGWADLTACFPLSSEPSPPRCGFTFPNALKWAQGRSNGARIDVYGFDCADIPTDFTGQPGDHSEARWAKELPWVKQAWGPNVRVCSNLPEAVRSWLVA